MSEVKTKLSTDSNRNAKSTSAPAQAQTPAPSQAPPEQIVPAAEQPTEKPKRFGIPESQFNKLNLRQQKNLEMADDTSPLRNQASVADIVDFQLMSNTPAQSIQAMTGWSLEKLGARAKELETTLKGSLAGDFKPQG